MTRIEKLAKDISEENKYGINATLMALVKRFSPCSMCNYNSKEDICFTDKHDGKIKVTRCMALIAMNGDDYSKSCTKGIEEYMNEEVHDDEQTL